MTHPVMDGEARKHDAHTRLRAYRAARVCDWHSGLYYRVCCGLARPLPTTFATWCRFRTELGLGFLGAAPSELATAGIIVASGYRKSRRPEAQARPVTVWQLRSRKCHTSIAVQART